MSNESRVIAIPDELDTFVSDWTTCKILASASEELFPGGMSATLLYFAPGQGHARHNHPDAEQIIFIISGHASQIVELTEEQGGEKIEKVIGPGSLVHIPKGAYHSTFCEGWEPVKILALYSPGGSEVQSRPNSGFRSVAPEENPWGGHHFG
ncbi:MAG: cupin domain-containing protein [Paralcaligenes sp.]